MMHTGSQLPTGISFSFLRRKFASVLVPICQATYISFKPMIMMPETNSPVLLQSAKMTDPQNHPATAALERLINRLPDRQYKRATRVLPSIVEKPVHQIPFDIDDFKIPSSSESSEEGFSFPLIDWSFGDEKGDHFDDRDYTAPQPQDQSREMPELTKRLSLLGKRSRSLLATKCLVRSIALTAHLSLLESSICPLQNSFRATFEDDSSTPSCFAKFDVDKWIDIAERTKPEPWSHSEKKPVQKMSREESINASLYGLVLTT